MAGEGGGIQMISKDYGGGTLNDYITLQQVPMLDCRDSGIDADHT